MILELLAVGLIVSACLAIYLDKAIYSVAALADTFIFMAIIFALNGAVFVAVYHFVVGIGTLSVFFLSAEMLSEKLDKKEPLKNSFLVISAGLILSLPVIFLSVTTSTANFISDVPFSLALWNLREIDVLLQGVVMMTVAIGIGIILYERSRSKG